MRHFHSLALFFVYSSLGYYISAMVAGLRFARESRRPPGPLPSLAPSVLILRPLHGFSEQMVDNVRNLLAVDYPNRRIVLGATSETDGSARIVHAIKAEFPASDLICTFGQYPTGNPKVGKLMWMLERAPHADVVMMIDADGRVERDHVRRVVSELYADDRVGLVTSIYCARPAYPLLGARLEALFINTDFAPLAILSKYFERVRHAYASCIAVKKRVFDAIGGLSDIKDCFGDDLMLGRKVAASGLEVKVSSAVVTMVTEERTLAEFWGHQLRGWRVDRRIRPISCGRILINGPFWALLCLFSGANLFAIKLFSVVLAMRIAMAAWMIRVVFRLPLSFKDLLLVAFKDLLLVGIWAASFMGNKVEWGGKQRILTADGKMQEVA